MAKTKEAPVDETNLDAATEPVAAPKVDGDRKARWAQFLAQAEAQASERGTSEIFAAQKARGEFDTIPDSFI